MRVYTGKKYTLWLSRIENGKLYTWSEAVWSKRKFGDGMIFVSESSKKWYFVRPDHTVFIREPHNNIHCYWTNILQGVKFAF